MSRRFMEFLLFILTPLAESCSGKNEHRSDADPDLWPAEKPACEHRSGCSATKEHCEGGWTYFKKTGACYKNFFWENFDNAEKVCKKNEGHLVSIHSREENDLIASLAKTGIQWSEWTQLTWIGLRKSPGSDDWSWTDDTDVDYLAWAPNEPSNTEGKEHCVELFSDDYHIPNPMTPFGSWNDLDCSEKMRSFVCKKKALH
ncbi:unnamed protein product [Cylicocyclus nassatus]|uniref:C-type lectin domain-containing protein n=1 Tax=Cylicocyclus nassatus TaxID=53992 RepID=A0AA36M5T7_CYLNA|nr:unnamed protein product [Cylicocyclus nassatus]